MSQPIVALPDGRLAIPLDLKDATELGLTVSDSVDIRTRYGILEAVKTNPYRNMPTEQLFALVTRRETP